MTPRRPAVVFDGFFSETRAAVVDAIRAVDALDGPPLRVEELDDPAAFPGDTFRFLDLGAALPHPAFVTLGVRRVPVPPPLDRPLVPPFTSTQKLPWAGPLNLAWRALFRSAERHARLFRQERDALIAALVVVVEHTRAPPSPLARDGWEQPDALERADALDVVPAGGLRAVARPAPDELRAVFVGARRLAIQRGFSVSVVDVVTGERLARPMGCARWLRSAAHGRFLLFDGWQVVDWLDDDDADAVYDLDAGAYLDAYPDDVRVVVVDANEPPHQRLRHRRRGLVLNAPDPDDHAPPEGRVNAASADGKFAWLGDAARSVVVDVDNGIAQVNGPRLLSDVGAHAVCVVDDAWRFFAGRALYGEDGFPVDVGVAGAVAFDAGGGFVRVFDDQFVVHDVDGAVVRHVRYDW